MKSLFIIGNGFDLAHKLPTSYQDFHIYLKCTYPEAKESVSFMLESITLPDGGEEYKIENVVSILIDLISMAEKDGDEWKDFENNLANLDFESYLAEMHDFLYDSNDDSGGFKMAYRNEDVSTNFLKVSRQFKELFSEWIYTIDVSNIKPLESFENIIDIENDIFLTFNYTSVLEDVYYAHKVFHMHGEQGGDIILGHGDTLEEGQLIGELYVGAEYNLTEIHESLRKDTYGTIQRHKDLFERISDVNKIYSYGFSFSDVDLPYVTEICKNIDTENVIWYLNSYGEDSDRDIYKEKIRKCGFEGKFSIFS
ncbi:bacteriophage abortive infection AbiH family protein [Niallia circulans]